MCTIKWGNIEYTNQRSEAVLLNPRSNSLCVYLRRCRTALVGYMLDQSNFLMCVTYNQLILIKCECSIYKHINFILRTTLIFERTCRTKVFPDVPF